MNSIKFSVITQADWLAGFKLAGVDVLMAEDSGVAQHLLIDMIHQKEPHLVAIEEDLMPSNNKTIQKHLAANPYPIVIALPKINVDKMEDQQKYVSELVKSCIGFYVKLK